MEPDNPIHTLYSTSRCSRIDSSSSASRSPATHASSMQNLSFSKVVAGCTPPDLTENQSSCTTPAPSPKVCMDYDEQRASGEKGWHSNKKHCGIVGIRGHHYWIHTCHMPATQSCTCTVMSMRATWARKCKAHTGGSKWAFIYSFEVQRHALVIGCTENI